MPEILSREPRVTEARMCRIPLSSYSDRRVIIDFDPNDPYILPCENVFNISGGVIPDATTPEVPFVGCLKQRQAKLCPRGLGLKPE